MMSHLQLSRLLLQKKSDIKHRPFVREHHAAAGLARAGVVLAAVMPWDLSQKTCCSQAVTPWTSQFMSLTQGLHW